MACASGGRTRSFVLGNFDKHTDWSEALHKVEVVVHLAGVAEAPKNDQSETVRSNVDAAINLAKQAEKHGVRRLVFLSSIKVNGDQSFKNKPFTEMDAPNPKGVYAKSKLHAEELLNQLSDVSNLEIVIIRCPLIYGRGMKGNLIKLVNFVRSGFPVPLGAVNNRRSYLSIDALNSFIALCSTHHASANQTFLISDPNTLSTGLLVRLIDDAFGNSGFIVSFPIKLIWIVLFMTGNRSIGKSLLSSSEIDTTKAKDLLGWKSNVETAEELGLLFRKLASND